MKKTISTLLLLALLSAPCAQAQEAPAPHRMPRTPVSRELIAEPRDPMPASRQLQGPAAVIDGEKLRIDKMDVRLFGIVPPQLSASFGPQARAVLDTLANGQSVTCHIRDRDHEGRLLATCNNASGSDMALELLKRGLAVTARGSLMETELATSYLAAEQTAQNEKLGLWSTAPATPVAAAAPAPAPTVAPQPKPEVAVAAPAKPEVKEIKKEEKTTSKTDSILTSTAQASETQAKIAADVIAQHAQEQAKLDDSVWMQDESAGFFERYQILIASFLMLATALSIMGVFEFQKRREQRDELKSIAAALRGELMAARSVCVGRSRSITTEEEDREASWPRIRATLYQAYVGRLGLLGAELARQVASTYGRSSDYTALYTTSGALTETLKKQALETLVKHIDEILPKLASIEQTGLIPTARAQQYRQRYAAQQQAPVYPTTPKATYAPTQQQGAHQAHVTTSVAAAARETVAAATQPQPEAYYAPQHQAAQHPSNLWHAVQDFIRSHTPAPPPPLPMDPHDEMVSEYAAMIEADMARYQYHEEMEPLDISPQKKRG